MVAYENNSDKRDDKTYQVHGYRSPSSVIKTQYNFSDKYRSLYNRLSPGDPIKHETPSTNEGTIDRLVRYSDGNESNQPIAVPQGRTFKENSHATLNDRNYFSRPIWFYKIMEKLTSDKVKQDEQNHIDKEYSVCRN